MPQAIAKNYSAISLRLVDPKSSKLSGKEIVKNPANTIVIPALTVGKRRAITLEK